MRPASASIKNYRPNVIASSKSWNKNLAKKLAEVTGEEFVLISDPFELTVSSLKKINPDYIFFPHWSQIIGSEIYDNFKCIIFHMTDLPFGRGGSPLQNLIVRGIHDTQVSAIRCVKEVDAGPVYLKKPLSLYGSAEEIYMRASDVIENMIIEIIQKDIIPKNQGGAPTLFKRRKPNEGNLEEATSLKQVFDMIRMLDAEGYPHAFISVGDFQIEFTRASYKSDGIVADVKIKLKTQDKEKEL